MKNSFTSKLWILFLSLSFSLILTSCSYLKSVDIEDDFDDEIEKLIEILKEGSFYYEGDDELLEGALRGVVASLEDPYSTYFSEEEYNEFINSLQGTFAGLGITIGTKGHYPIITSVIKNSPAENIGLQAGDTLISVDDVDLKGKTPTEIALLIKGPTGTERTLIIARESMNDPLEPIKVNLNTVSTDTVTYHIDEKENQKIGYLYITTFGDPTVEEFEQAMNYFNTNQIDGLIIDVRDNPGGYLTTVTSILDYFIDDEKPFMYQQYKNEDKKPGYLKDGNSYDLEDIVILINEHSASASEIFAAAMNELKGYELIGKTTFGKGTVQVTQFIDQKQTKSVKFTTSIWLTPNGNWIHENGVKPTIEVGISRFEGLGYIEYSTNLAFDHVDEEIKQMQVLLDRLGYETRTDGYFNNQTGEAIKGFQRDYMGLDQVTGYATEETIYEMNLALIDYLEDLNHDDQYLKAIEYILK